MIGPIDFQLAFQIMILTFFKGDNLFIGILDKTDNKGFHVLYDLKENRIKRIITDE